MVERVWIDGEESEGRIEVTDSSVLRGDGCFEVLRAYGGVPFALEQHLDRLERSAAKLQIHLPAREDIASWIGKAAADEPEGAVRVVVTRGSALPGAPGEPRVIVFAHPWERGAEHVRLLPVVAPWHSSGEDWELAGAKILSYAPNLAATRAAVGQGFDDALLVSREGLVLEGPTFSVAWVVGGSLETPSLGNGILDSITRRHVLELARDAGIEVVEGAWAQERLGQVDEIMALSTIRQVQAVVQVGDARYEPGPVTQSLAGAFAQLVGSPLARHGV